MTEVIHFKAQDAVVESSMVRYMVDDKNQEEALAVKPKKNGLLTSILFLVL